MITSLSPGTPLKLPKPENCQSSPTVPKKRAVTILLLLMP
jgi:hypothetical protein